MTTNKYITHDTDTVRAMTAHARSAEVAKLTDKRKACSAEATLKLIDNAITFYRSAYKAQTTLPAVIAEDAAEAVAETRSEAEIRADAQLTAILSSQFATAKSEDRQQSTDIRNLTLAIHDWIVARADASAPVEPSFSRDEIRTHLYELYEATNPVLEGATVEYPNSFKIRITRASDAAILAYVHYNPSENRRKDTVAGFYLREDGAIMAPENSFVPEIEFKTQAGTKMKSRNPNDEVVEVPTREITAAYNKAFPSAKRGANKKPGETPAADGAELSLSDKLKDVMGELARIRTPEDMLDGLDVLVIENLGGYIETLDRLYGFAEDMAKDNDEDVAPVAAVA